jgi:ABC-type branched-subunit amino acid transport system substrate-binding protein
LLLVQTASYGKSLGIAIKRLREYKFAGPILTNLGFVLTPDAVSAAGDAADGVYHNAFAIRPGDERYQTFVQAYQRRFGTEPPSFAVFEYNTVLLISHGLSKGGYDSGKIADAIRAEKTFRGAGESMSLSAKGDVLPDVIVVRHGERAR